METSVGFNLPVAEMLVDTVPVDTEGPAVQAELDTQIESTHFTVGQVVSLMTGKDSEWDALVSTRELKDVVVQRISIGFLSFVARISFHFDGLDEPYSVILKVPSTENVVALNNNVTQEYVSFRVKALPLLKI
ncbi:hypothetical protein AAVH_41216 [Aphelenchoides avenae]|nr:hypothetical protein AAVH_41216 [Aphelenchus avenae]